MNSTAWRVVRFIALFVVFYSAQKIWGYWIYGVMLGGLTVKIADVMWEETKKDEDAERVYRKRMDYL